METPTQCTRVSGKCVLSTAKDERALFDHCSSDSWCTAEFARKVRARKLDDWTGQLRTIRGVESVKLPAVEIKVYNHETGQIVKIEALVTRDIGTKPIIDEPRFTRLCSL